MPVAATQYTKGSISQKPYDGQQRGGGLSFTQSQCAYNCAMHLICRATMDSFQDEAFPLGYRKQRFDCVFGDGRTILQDKFRQSMGMYVGNYTFEDMYEMVSAARPLDFG